MPIAKGTEGRVEEPQLLLQAAADMRPWPMPDDAETAPNKSSDTIIVKQGENLMASFNRDMHGALFGALLLSSYLLGAPSALAGLALTTPPPHAESSNVEQAGQIVDDCYQKCFLNAKGWSERRKYACRNACKAKPRQKCEDKCWLNFGNDPKGRKKCLSRCS